MCAKKRGNVTLGSVWWVQEPAQSQRTRRGPWGSTGQWKAQGELQQVLRQGQMMMKTIVLKDQQRAPVDKGALEQRAQLKEEAQESKP